MTSFTCYNPVKLVFGKGMIAELKDLIPPDLTVMLTYGGGSIKKNGVYDQVRAALADRTVVEFGGIEPNPRYETCMRAAELAKSEGVGFLLAVGGGSVLDATKFIAIAALYDAGDPWEIMEGRAPIEAAMPLGAVLTLPATGSEMNTNAVISRESTGEKLSFGSPHVYPQFSILDASDTVQIVSDVAGDSDKGIAKQMQWQISSWKNAMITPEPRKSESPMSAPSMLLSVKSRAWPPSCEPFVIADSVAAALISSRGAPGCGVVRASSAGPRAQLATKSSAASRPNTMGRKVRLASMAPDPDNEVAAPMRGH